MNSCTKFRLGGRSKSYMDEKNKDKGNLEEHHADGCSVTGVRRVSGEEAYIHRGRMRNKEPGIN